MNDLQGSSTLVALRDFLRSHSCASLPWDPPQRVIDRLYSALSERRQDERFWRELRSLVGRLEDGRFDADAFAALDLGQREQLIDALRASLDSGNGSGLKGWLSRPMSTAALLGLLVLGSATACLDSQQDQDETVACDSAWEMGYEDEEAAVYCELVGIVSEADVSAGVRSDIMSCLPQLNASYREMLLDLFQRLPDEELADYLTEMTDDGGLCSDENRNDAGGGDSGDDSGDDGYDDGGDGH